MGRVELWRELGRQLRVDSIRSSDAAGSGHPTSSMSAADLMAVLISDYLRYDFDSPGDPNNDHLVFSKGHASPLLYAMFKAAGAIDDKEMLTFRKFGSRLQGHPTPVIEWVDVATGSLGTGPPHRRRHRRGGQEPRPPALPRLGALRRQRDVRGLHVGGIRARVPRRARQPHGHHRRQPAGPARRDQARLGPGQVLRQGQGLRLARHRDRRPRLRADRRGLRRGGPDDRQADGHRSQDRQGQRRRRHSEPGRTPRQAPRRPGRRGRGAGRRPKHRRGRIEAGGRTPAPRIRARARHLAQVRIWATA